MSRESWVLDASPLIALGNVGRLGLLVHPDRDLLVPDAVAREIRAAPYPDPTRAALDGGFAAPKERKALIAAKRATVAATRLERTRQHEIAAFARAEKVKKQLERLQAKAGAAGLGRTLRR